MNFDRKIEQLEEKAKSFSIDLKAFNSSLEEAKIFTAQFLSKCSDYKIKKVCIGRSHESVKSSVNFPFGPDESVFADEKSDDWPAIWRVVEELGISGGCGNSGQHSANLSRLIDGVYHFRNGVWKKVD